MVDWGWLAVDLGVEILNHYRRKEYIQMQKIAFPYRIVENSKVDKTSPTQYQVAKFNRLMFDSKNIKLRRQIWAEVHNVDISRREMSGYIDKLQRAESGLSDEVKKNLKCPHCESKVYDNRDTKYNDAAPDFVCSNNNPDECEGHNGKFKKGWWLDSRDLPDEWFKKK